jgi:hypothetical protein
LSSITSTTISEKSTLNGARAVHYLREAVQEINRLRDLSNELRSERDALAYANQKLKYRLSRLGGDTMEGVSPADVTASMSAQTPSSDVVAPAMDLAHMADMIKAQLDSLEEFSRKLEAENAVLRGSAPSPVPSASMAEPISFTPHAAADEPVSQPVLPGPAPFNNVVHIPLDKRENPLRLKKEVGPAEGASIFAVRRQHPVRKAGFIKNIFGQSSE